MRHIRVDALIAVFVIGIGIAAVAAVLWGAVVSDGASGISVGDAATSSLATSTLATSSLVALPLRLRIPTIGIDAHIKQVGVTSKGEMATPGNFTDVAWYKYGPKPGESGSAVIDGHVDNGLSLAAVFKRLHELKVGDEIFVDTEDAKTLHFVVTATKSYPYNEAPTNVIFNTDGAARLNLITCTGSWLAGAHSYDQRLVVFTNLE